MLLNSLKFIQSSLYRLYEDDQYNNIHMCECLAGATCCLCSCCCQETAQGLRKAIGREKYTKFCYLFIVIVFTVPAILILFFINRWDGFKNHFDWMSCPQSTGGGQFECIGSSTVFRISISFLALFGIMLLFMLCRCRPSMCINQGLFCIKYFFVLCLFIGLLFAPNSSFTTYADASKVISIGFMIIQAIVLIDLFYLAGIQLVAKYDQGQTHFAGVLIFLALLFEGIAVMFNVLGYIYFGSSDSCGSTLWVNVITSIIIFGLPFLQLLHFNKQNSLLTTSLVSLYISYLAFISQFSYCGNPNSSRVTVASIAVDIIISTFFFLLTMYGSIMGGSGQVKYSQQGNLNTAMGVAPTQDAQNSPQQIPRAKQQSAQRLEDPQTDAVALSKYTDSWEWVKWHFFMCLASIYMAMLITNWDSASPTTGDLVPSGFGFWVRVIMSWLTTLIYIWTLVAPKCFPERDFTVN